MTTIALDVQFGRILDAISDGVYVTTDEREIVFWSKGAERITGYTADEVVGKHCFDNILVHTDLEGTNLCLDGCPLQSSLQTGKDRTVNEVFLKCKNGERLPVYVKTSLYNHDGRDYAVEIFGELESVAGEDLVARVQELSDSSITDSLSGLFNRRYLDAALSQQFALWERTGRRFGVLYLDIDEFKSINDSLGHSGGDEAIKFLARVIKGSARQMDVAGRYGGDEFVIICAIASPAELLAYGHRLLELVRQSRFGLAEGIGKHLTVSVGATMVAAGDADERASLERADLAMYEAKHRSRDDMVFLREV